MGRIKDLTGLRFGNLVVIRDSKTRDSGRHQRWECLCDCGSVILRSGNELNRSRTYSKVSCGCQQKLPDGVGNKRVVILHYMNNAARRSLTWNLTEERASELFQFPCHYCGSPPSNIENRKGSNGAFVYSGLDRIDNSRGYEEDNVVPSCKVCNRAKRELSVCDFKNWIARLVKHQLRGCYASA